MTLEEKKLLHCLPLCSPVWLFKTSAGLKSFWEKIRVLRSKFWREWNGNLSDRVEVEEWNSEEAIKGLLEPVAPAVIHAMETLASKIRELETLRTSEDEFRNSIGLFLAFVGCLSSRVLFQITPEDISLSEFQIEIRTTVQLRRENEETHTMCFAQTNSNPLCRMLRWLKDLGLQPASPIWPAKSEPELLKLLQDSLPHLSENVGLHVNLDILRHSGARCAANFTSQVILERWSTWFPDGKFRWWACDPPAQGSELHKTMVALFPT